MKKFVSIFYLICFILIVISCETPRKLTKKGNKYSDKQMYSDACQLYFKALNKKRDYLPAKEGLKFAGEKQINSYLDDFFKTKNFGEQRKAIYLYRDAFQLQSKIKRYYVNIDIPQHYVSDYNQILDEYVEKTYNEAISLLDKENFSQAEKLFKEINLLKPNYKDVDEMKDIATYEPIYRQGNNLLEMQKFRSAYYAFNRIPSNYKDANELKLMAQKAGMFTLAILKFENYTSSIGVESAISANVTEELMKLNNPFLKLVNRDLTNTFINEQVLGMSGQVEEGTSAKAGELIGAKAVLTGKLVTCNKVNNPISKVSKKGWSLRRIKKTDADGKKYYDTVYDKIRYSICSGNSKVDIGFQFQLSSTESSEILYTQLINKSKRDNVNYAESSSNYRNIIPGNWTWQNKNSNSDYRNDSKSDIRKLRALFKNKKTLLSAEQLSQTIYKEIAKEISTKVNNYSTKDE